MTIPMLWPDDTANTRRTDPLTSHKARDGAVKRVPTKYAVEQETGHR